MARIAATVRVWIRPEDGTGAIEVEREIKVDSTDDPAVYTEAAMGAVEKARAATLRMLGAAAFVD